MRASLGAYAAVVSAAALASSGASAGDALSTAGMIAYESQSTVFVADAGGAGAPRALSSGHAPSWSPDGTKLVIDAGVDLETIGVDGSQRTVLVAGSGLIGPAWSPDGSKIAYADLNQASGGIWVVPAGGGAPVRLSSAGVETSPTWSPDGTKIAFLESDNTANPPSIWIMNADGSNPHKLVTADLPDPGGVDLRNLAWSPDGTKLLYSTGAEPEIYGVGARPASIAVVDADGSNEHILVAAPQHSTFTDPSWSPDGTSIIFSDTNLAGPVETTQGLDIANADGSGRRSLLTAPGGYTLNTAQWLAGVPGVPTGVSAVAGDGKVTIGFGAPGANGGAAITSYTVTVSPGGVTATGPAGPLTITGLTNGTTYTFSIVAANRVGVGAAATVSATPVGAGSSGGGGSGGGGGGGGGGAILPDLQVALSASSANVPSAGSELDFFATVSMKNAGNQSEGRLALSLPPGYAVNRVYTDRGSCQIVGTTVDCNVAWINQDTATHVVVFGTVVQQAPMTVTATTRGLLEPELDPSNNTLTLTLPLPAASSSGGTGAKTPPAQPIRPPTITGSATVGKTVKGTPGTWAEQPTRVSYQWQLCTAKGCTAIIGATKQRLKIRATYAGRSIRLAVTALVGGQTVRILSKKIAVHKS